MNNRLISFRAWYDSRMYQPALVGGTQVPQVFTSKCDLVNLCTIEEEYHVMQYTGLKDKNGVEIYEGDIVVSKYINPLGQLTTDRDEDSIGKITFENGTFALRKNYMGYEAIPLRNFCHRKEGEYQSNFGVMVDYSDETILEVIGNVHENPELLK